MSYLIFLQCDRCQEAEPPTPYYKTGNLSDSKFGVKYNAEKLGWQEIKKKWYCTECQGTVLDEIKAGDQSEAGVQGVGAKPIRRKAHRRPSTFRDTRNGSSSF